MITDASGQPEPNRARLSREAVQRLAFIRLLYQSGLREANQPAPLNARSVLTLHDACDLLLGLVADTLGASLAHNTDFISYWNQLAPSKLQEGVELPARQRMQRVNRVRIDLKHHGILPATETVRQVATDVAVFVEDSVQLVYGTSLDAIELADIVPQPEIRATLQEASAASASGDYNLALSKLAIAFSQLVDPLQGPYAEFSFGRNISKFREAKIEKAVSAAATGVKPQDARRATQAARAVDGHIKSLTDAVESLQRGVRVMALGIEFGHYARFARLVPRVTRLIGPGEDRFSVASLGYTPGRDQYVECVDFVVSVALRIAELAETRPSRPGQPG